MKGNLSKTFAKNERLPACRCLLFQLSTFGFQLLFLLLFLGCAVGPDYQRPIVNVPPGWKEVRPQESEGLTQWWKTFGDTNLNTLIEQALEANQDLKHAALRVEEARAVSRVSAADFYPNLTFDPSYSRTKYSPNRPKPIPFQISSFTTDDFQAPFDLSYEIDIWGRVRRSFEATVTEAQAYAAVYRTVRLTLTADVAQNYFLLRSFDAESVILQRTIALRKEALKIVNARYKAGLVSGLDVAQAETELATAEVELPDVTRRRTELENALAVLCGKPASEFSLSANPLDLLPPQIPPGLPSDLLERRPDIIEAERLMAATSARIGVAKAAFFPTIHLTGSAGFESAELSSLFDWESRLWSFGPTISIPIFQGGRNKANLEAAKVRYEEAFSQFRQKILVAFREVEDALANLRLRAEQAEAQARAVTAARETTSLATLRYKQGLVNYLEVLEAGRAQLQTERAATQILGQRLAYSVLLIKALGGGWGTTFPAQQEEQ